jgi:hypothetical protein
LKGEDDGLELFDEGDGIKRESGRGGLGEGDKRENDKKDKKKRKRV